jgi:hypothetical protein
MRISTLFDLTRDPMDIGIDEPDENMTDERIDQHFRDVADAVKKEFAKRRADDSLAMPATQPRHS